MNQVQQDAGIRLAIAGDVGIRRPDPTSIFTHVADVLRAADVTLVNQEWPFTEQGTPWPGKTHLLPFVNGARAMRLFFSGSCRNAPAPPNTRTNSLREWDPTPAS